MKSLVPLLLKCPDSLCSGSGGPTDDGEPYVDEKYWSPCTGSYTTLEQLQERKGSIPGHCIEQYLVDVQVVIYEGALKKYKELIDNGYDNKFKTYERYVKAQVPDQINNFMASDKVDKYFKCKETKDITCCSSCRYATCAINCVKGSDCKNGRGTIDMDKCPKMEHELPTIGSDVIPNATYTLTDSQGFYKDILETWGIEESWIRYDKRHMRTNNGCQYAGEKVLECIAKNDNWFHNYPLANNDKISIYNPKKIIGDSLPKANEMLDRFKIMDQFGDWDEQTQLSDLVDATSLPAFSTVEAVDSMSKIVDKANEIEKKEREEFILNFITGLLFWIPFIGSAAGAAGLTTARSLLSLIGVAGEVGVMVYEVVKDPQNAFMAVFSALAGAGLGGRGFRSAADSRRKITPGSKEYESLGNVRPKLDKVQDIRGIMCPI